MKRFFLLAFIASLSLHGQSPRYGALLWKISGNGLDKPSYLYGTMHVSNRVAYYLSEEFFDALKSVEMVGLETNPGEWLDNMEKTGELSQLTRVSEPMSRNFYKSAFHLSFPEKRIFQGILSYDPDIINGLLYRQNKSRENFEESTYIDLFIYQTAAKLNKPVISLEDFTTSEIKSRLSSVPDSEEEDARRYTDYVNAQKIEDAYRQGNLDVIDSLSKLSTSRNMQKYLINERNIDFAQTIDSVMKKHSIFSGVGAAHLPGELGVIELLRAKGYKLEPVEPRISKKSHKEREELDQRVKPVTFTTQYATDSLFSVELPGKLYKILDAGQLKYYIHADMVNGSFYSVARLKHMGPLFNITPAQVYSKVDSLLFEHIPGRIIEKNQLTSGPHKGIEIVNRTRSGDDQHYQIFFTDQEMILFKLGGKQSYATGEEGKKFFGSIRFSGKAASSHPFSPATGGFTVDVAGDFYYEKHEQVGVAGVCEDLFMSSGRTAKGVRHAVYNDFSYLEEDTFELNQLAGNILTSYNYNLDRTLTLTTADRLPAITFSGRSAAGRWLTGKIIIRGVHYYFVYEVDSVATDPAKGFISSFRTGDFRHIHPIRRITDKDLHFTADDEVTDDAQSRFNEMYSKAYAQALGKNDSAAPSSGYRSASKFYYSPSSNEYVGISFEEYSNYDYRDPKATDQSLQKNFKNNTSMFVVKGTERPLEKGREFSYVLGDTATRRVLGVKVIFTGNRMYELTAPYDSVTGMRGWQKGFFESFTPLDSGLTGSIFENDFKTLLKHLSGSDSVSRHRANQALADGLAMHSDFAKDYVNFLGSGDVRGISEDSKAHLFVNGGTMRDNRIVAPYKKLYIQYTDSFYLQLCLLKGLAYAKTNEAFRAFAELILKEPPLVGDEASVNDVFSVLRDSLPLCKDFFPAMLALTRYEEFRNPVYALLGDLVDGKLISPSRYLKDRQAIITDAMLALKRYNPSKKEETEGGLSHLDRQTRELAETIRRSLEGLANNIQSGIGHDNTTESAIHPLVTYATILAPLYHKDPQAKAFFARLQRVKNHEILLPATVNLLRYNITVSDSLVDHYAADPHTRAYFYSELERLNIEHKFDSRFLSQQKLIESLLISQRQLNTLYGYDRGRSQSDSLIFVKAIAASNKYQRGTIYVYKTGSSRGDSQWSAVFVNHGGGDVTSRMELLSAGFPIDPSKSEEENLQQLTAHFQLSYRKRALVNAGT